MGQEREAPVTNAPAGLAIDWSPVGASIACRPLGGLPRVVVFGRAATWTGACLLVTAVGLVPLRLFDLVPLALPPIALLACPVVALLFELVAELRRTASEMTMKVGPGSLVVEHRMFGLTLATEAFDLDEVRRFEVDDRHRLVVLLRETPARYEPIYGLPAEARDFLVDLLEDARQSGTRFSRDRLASTADAAAIERLVSRSTSTSHSTLD